MMNKYSNDKSYINLHIHTTASDGFDSPVDIVRKAARYGLAAISITDHDTVLGINSAIPEAKKRNIELIPGIELSVNFDPIMHILGLYIDINNSDLNAHIKKISKVRMQLVSKSFKIMNDNGIMVTPQQVVKRYKILSMENLIKTLVDNQVIHCIDEANIILSDIWLKWRNSLPTMEDCISLIHNSNGIAILAHAKLLNLDDAQLYRTIEKMKNYGLDGIEIVHPAHNAEDRVKFKNWADEIGLLYSGGSDYHSVGKRNYLVESNDGEKAPYLYLAKIKKYLENNRNS